MAERTQVQQFLVVVGLTGFAFTQPLLSLLGENPTLFSRYRVTDSAMVVFGLALAVVPPVLLWGIGAVTALVNRHAGDVVHLVTVVVLVALTAARVIRNAGLRPNVLVIPLSVLAGVLFAVACARFTPLALWARFTAFLPLLAVALFLFTSPAGSLATSRSSADDGERSSAPVVFVVLDELPTISLLTPDGELDADRFPNLVRFAEDATWYRHFTTMAPTTLAAVPSILSGRAPTGSEAVPESYPDNLFTLLDPTHDLVVGEHSTALCTFDDCEDPTPAPENSGAGALLGTALDLWAYGVGWGAPQDDDESPAFDFDQFIAGEEAYAAPERVRSLVDSIDPQRPSTLYYLHLMLPHFPWVTWPDGSTYREPDVLGLGLPTEDQELRWTWSEAEARVSEQRHLLQAQNADRLVGELLDGVRDAGLYDDALIVVVGDHGASFEPEADMRLPTEATLDRIAYTPLLIKEPGQAAGRIDDSNLVGVDVLPTVAAALELEVDWEVDGYPASAPEVAARGTTKPFYFVSGLFNETIETVGEFDDAMTFPDPADRWIGGLPDAADPLSGLGAALEVEERLGTSFEDLAAAPSGTVAIHGLDSLVDASSDAPPMKVVQARIDDGPTAGTAYLGVDDMIVAAGELAVGADGVARVTMLLPPEATPTRANLRFAVVDAASATELTITG